MEYFSSGNLKDNGAASAQKSIASRRAIQCSNLKTGKLYAVRPSAFCLFEDIVKFWVVWLYYVSDAD
jgi:hypothetical protein